MLRKRVRMPRCCKAVLIFVLFGKCALLTSVLPSKPVKFMVRFTICWCSLQPLARQLIAATRRFPFNPKCTPAQIPGFFTPYICACSRSCQVFRRVRFSSAQMSWSTPGSGPRGLRAIPGDTLGILGEEEYSPPPRLPQRSSSQGGDGAGAAGFGASVHQSGVTRVCAERARMLSPHLQ